MTNKEVINFLNQVRKILLDDKSWLESTIQPINEAFDMAINALTAQPEQQWIPCSEHMPKDGDSCLVLFDENLLDADENLVGDALWKDGQWQYFAIRTFEQSGWHISFEPVESLKVIAWMPLPEQYKEWNYGRVYKN